MLRSFTVHFSDSPDVTLEAKGAIIIVGPNNSGKSMLLREIEKHITGDYTTRIVKETEFGISNESQLKEIVERLRPPESFNYDDHIDDDSPNVEYITLVKRGLREPTTLRFPKNAMEKYLRGEGPFPIGPRLARLEFIRLDGEQRLTLTRPIASGDLMSPSNMLAVLYTDNEKRRAVQDAIKDAFGLVPLIDPSGMAELKVKLSDKAPPNERSLDNDTLEHLRRAKNIDQYSDGVRAYCGIVMVTMTGDFATILIDEPEAFLHPPLARRLGGILTKQANKSGGVLIAATHSTDFLMGCLQASADVQILRMEYRNERSFGRLISSGLLRESLFHPLLRSTNALSSLFYDGVVVVEDDNDRAFYSEIYDRMSGTEDLPSLLFINARNKHTIPEVMRPLRQFGLPVVGVPDIDFVKDGGAAFTRWLEAGGVPKAHASRFAKTGAAY